MAFNEKPTKNRKLRGLKLRGLRRNSGIQPNHIQQIHLAGYRTIRQE